MPGTKIDALVRAAARATRASRAVRTWTRPREVARDRRPADERLRPQQHELPAGQLAQRAHHRARDDALVRPQLERRSASACSRARRARCRRRARAAGSRRGSAPPPRRAPRSESAISASRRAEQLLALRARRRVAEPVRREEGRDRRARPRRAARGRRATAGRARSRGRRRSRRARARARGSRGRRRGRPSASGARSAPPAPTAITSGRVPAASARRPASRSAARVDGASTVTSWPERRAARPRRRRRAR